MRPLCSQRLLAMYGACQVCEQCRQGTRAESWDRHAQQAIIADDLGSSRDHQGGVEMGSMSSQLRLETALGYIDGGLPDGRAGR